jgi:lactoylglutathione lyase/glyoxylase I family protein
MNRDADGEPMISGIAHVCLAIQDLERTRKFYCDQLGLGIAFKFLREGQVCGYYFRVADRNFIEAFPRSAHPRGEPGITHICLETDDIKGLHERLEAQGIECQSITLGCDGSYQFWVKDPDGNDIEFHEYTAQSSQLTGADAQATW